MLGALAFLTVLGRARHPAPHQQYWFPVVGAAVGAVVGLVYWGATQWWPVPVAAALAVVADLCLTGMLHIDGLADSADGLLPHLSPERRLEVMSAPDTGAFGVAVVAVVLILRWAGWASVGLTGSQVVSATAGLWALSRGLMALVLRVGRYARPGGGIAEAFGGGGRQSRRGTLVLLLITAVLGGGGVMLGRGALAGLAVSAVSVIVGLGVIGMAHRRIAGYTGDVLGASGTMLETAGLIALAARP